MQVGIKRTTVQNDKISNFFDKNQPGYRLKQATLNEVKDDGSLDILTSDSFENLNFDVMELP
jgi:hypothetical protein